MDLKLDIKAQLCVDADFDPGEPPVFASRPENSSPGSPAETAWRDWHIELGGVKILKSDLSSAKQAEIELAYEDEIHEKACDEAFDVDDYMEEAING